MCGPATLWLATGAASGTGRPGGRGVPPGTAAAVCRLGGSVLVYIPVMQRRKRKKCVECFQQTIRKTILEMSGEIAPEWELSKENVQPIKRGRRVEALNAALERPQALRGSLQQFRQ